MQGFLQNICEVYSGHVQNISKHDQVISQITSSRIYIYTIVYKIFYYCSLYDFQTAAGQTFSQQAGFVVVLECCLEEVMLWGCLTG